MSAETASGFGTEKVLHFWLDSLFASGENRFAKPSKFAAHRMWSLGWFASNEISRCGAQTESFYEMSANKFI